MEAYMSYEWGIYVMIGYFSLSILLLFLNKKWNWIYRAVLEIFVEKLTPPLVDPIEPGNLEKDPGLVFVLVIFGPALEMIGIALGIMAILCCLFFSAIVIFPRWIINCAIRK